MFYTFIKIIILVKYAHTIEKNKIIKNQDKFIYTIDGLLNNIQYGVQLNKISGAKSESLVKHQILFSSSNYLIFQNFKKVMKILRKNIHDLLKVNNFKLN